MTLKKWANERRLKHHVPSREEISDLFGLVDRDIKDAQIDALSADRRFATAYNAALQLGTVILRASGYRTSGLGHHWVTFQAISEILDADAQSWADYFDACRQKRNEADYDCAGMVTETEAKELLSETISFSSSVKVWLKEHHPELL